MSADGPLNIYNAVGICVDPKAKGRGVLVTVDDDIHAAHDVIKTHSTDVGTFSSMEAGLVGVSLFGKNIWYRTPESVNTDRRQFMNRWMPPSRAKTSIPGRSSRWYAFASSTCAPAASRSSTERPFTVAWVPTGMKSGVSTSPWSVSKRAALAREPLAVAITWKARRDMSVARLISQSDVRRANSDEALDNRPCRTYTTRMLKKQKPKRRRKTARLRAALKHKARRKQERKSRHKRVKGGR